MYYINRNPNLFMKRNLCIFILLFSLIFSFAFMANAQNVDSLYSVYTQAKDQNIKDDLAKSILSILNKAANKGIIYPNPEKYIELAAQYNNDSLIAKSCFCLAIHASMTADYNKSLDFFYKSLPFYEIIHDTLSISVVYKEIGINYKNLRNYDEAIGYFEKAITILNTLNLDKNGWWLFAVNYYQGLARIYLEKQNADSAFVKLQYAYDIFVKHEKDNKGLFQNGSIMADYHLRFNFLYANLFLQKKDTAIAEVHINECFKVVVDSLYYGISYYIDACLLYSSLKQSQGNYKNALSYADKAFKIGLKYKNKKFICDASEQLYRIYDEARQTDSAYYYLQQNFLYKDSINNTKVQSEIQNTTLLLHLDEIEKEAKQAKEKHRNQQNIQYVAITIGIIFLLLLFFLFSHSILIGTRTIEFIGTVILLMVFEFIFLYIHPYLGKWSNESPLFMLLALVLIASVLTPLHHKIEHWTKHKLIEKNKIIRLAHAKKTIKELEETDENNKTGQ